MFDNKYPYTDFHELNLDWFLAEFKKVMDDNVSFKADMTQKYETMDATVQQFTDFVTNYFDNLDVQQEINHKLDEMAADGTLSALIQPLFDAYKEDIDTIVEQQNQSIGTQNGRITTLEGRMDAFSTLAEGSTTGDAELMDIRVGANGITYASAGDAVRGQFDQLNDVIENYTSKTFTRTAGLGQYWNNNWSYDVASGAKCKLSLKAYGGSYFVRMYVNLYYNGSLVQDCGQITAIGGTLEFTATATADQIRTSIYTTADDGAINATYLWSDDQTAGIAQDLFNIKSSVAANTSDISNIDADISATTDGYDYYELVECDNLSGAWVNASTFAFNGEGISGYVCKYYDVENISKVKVSGTIYGIIGFNADGTKTTISATPGEKDVSDYYRIAVSGLKANFWSSSYIKVEAYMRIDSPYRNKKIVWYGTSIPAGGFKGNDNPLSYPFLVGRRLGATVSNEAVGESGVHYCEISRITTANPYGFNYHFTSAVRCLTNTLAMQTWLANWADYYCNGGTYQNSEPWDPDIFTSGLPVSWDADDTAEIMEFSYENRLDQYLTDATFPDLFVFDEGYNDRIKWSDAQGSYEAAIAAGYGRTNRFSFRGGMNFLIERIYAFRPNAKIVLIGDYENQSSEKGVDAEYQMKVAEDYELPICKRWELTSWSQNTIGSKWNWSGNLLTKTGSSNNKKKIDWAMADGVHPHSDQSGAATRLMADIITPFIAAN